MTDCEVYLLTHNMSKNVVAGFSLARIVYVKMLYAPARTVCQTVQKVKF